VTTTAHSTLSRAQCPVHSAQCPVPSAVHGKVVHLDSGMSRQHRSITLSKEDSVCGLDVTQQDTTNDTLGHRIVCTPGRIKGVALHARSFLHV